MRFDDEHAYDQRIYDEETIYQHLIPEHQFRRLITQLAQVQGNITGAYWLIDVVCALYPHEFPDNRKNLLKQVAMKIYTAYDDIPTKKQMATVMKEAGYTIKEIADNLDISRNSVYYFLKRHADLPTRCMLTYGEFNLMMDFMDLWEEIIHFHKL